MAGIRDSLADNFRRYETKVLSCIYILYNIREDSGLQSHDIHCYQTLLCVGADSCDGTVLRLFLSTHWVPGSNPSLDFCSGHAFNHNNIVAFASVYDLNDI